MITQLSLEEVMCYAPSAFTVERDPARTSNRYVHIPTHNVIGGLMDAGWAPVQARESRCRMAGNNGYQKHLIKFRRVEDLGKSQALIPHIMLTNSHNGTSAYRIMGGIFRMICTNGLIIAKSMVSDFRLRHSGRIEDLIGGANRIFDQMNKVFGRLDLWGGREMQAQERKDFAYAAAKLRWDGNLKIDPEMLLTARRREDDATDLWSTFNTVQENVMKGGIGFESVDKNNRIRRNSTRAITAVDADVKFNERLWELADSYMN